MAEEPAAPAPGRRRGLRLVVVAVLLLLLLVGVLAGLRPDLGAYESWQQIVVHLLWVLASTSFGVGVFRVIVGAPTDGVFRVVRTPVKLLVGVGSFGVFAVGAFLLHITLTYERTEHDADREHSDWDWD